MAVRAGGQALVERLVLEVAEEAGRGGHRHVLALHDLAVATGAAQLLAAAESRPGAACGRNGCPGYSTRPESSRVSWQPERRQLASGTSAAGPGPFALGDVLGQLHQAQHLAADLAAEARREVALDAGHVLVARLLPRLVVRLHDVAGVAELGARGVPARRADHQHQQQQKRPQQRGRAQQKPPQLAPHATAPVLQNHAQYLISDASAYMPAVRHAKA